MNEPSPAALRVLAFTVTIGLSAWDAAEPDKTEPMRFAFARVTGRYVGFPSIMEAKSVSAPLLEIAVHHSGALARM